MSSKILALWSFIIVMLCGCIFLNKKIDFKAALDIMLIIGIISETLKICSYIVANEETLNGYLPKTDLPFHLCSIQIIFMLILKLSKNENLKNILCSFMVPTCLIGGFAALMLPTSSSLNMWVITCQYFVYHIGIMWFAIYLLQSNEFKLTVKGYITTLLMLFGIFFIAIYLNSWIYDGRGNTDINFMYVVSPPKSGLPFLNKDHGWLVYIIHYAFLAVFCITVTYIKPIIGWFKNKKNKQEEK